MRLDMLRQIIVKMLSLKRIAFGPMVDCQSPEIQVLADYVTFDDSLLSDHNAALADKLSFKCTVNADIVRRIDLSLYYCSC